MPPRNDVERRLAGFWQELLGVEKIGVNDSFFDLGGHSLTAVRLFRMIKTAFAVEMPISVLFEAPTIAACAALLDVAHETPVEAEAPSARTAVHLVPMNGGNGSGATPLFLCAGMFGNVLNLRQLALHVGQERPVYGLQARGLYGGQEPHEHFEDAARDYLAEVRTVQPRGPYLLGGFSGGGLIAYEMARQLQQAGETVSLLVMLDTPIPFQHRLSLRDRLDMKLQDFQRHGIKYLAMWWQERREWAARQHQNEEPQAEGVHFHNAEIEAAFRRALARYELHPYSAKVLLLRPRLNIVYHLSGGRRLQDGRNPAMEDNGWGPYVNQLEVREVPGDHDSMVLEPYIRVMAGTLRAALAQADEKSEPMPRAAE